MNEKEAGVVNRYGVKIKSFKLNKASWEKNVDHATSNGNPSFLFHWTKVSIEPKAFAQYFMILPILPNQSRDGLAPPAVNVIKKFGLKYGLPQN